MPAFQRGAGNLSSATPSPANVYAGPPRSKPFESTNPEYRFRVLDGNGEPSNFWVTKEDWDIDMTDDPKLAWVSRSDDATAMCCIGRYQVIAELVEND